MPDALTVWITIAVMAIAVGLCAVIGDWVRGVVDPPERLDMSTERGRRAAAMAAELDRVLRRLQVEAARHGLADEWRAHVQRRVRLE